MNDEERLESLIRLIKKIKDQQQDTSDTDEDTLSNGANNPIYHCNDTDVDVDIVTMYQEVLTFKVSLEPDADKHYTYKADFPVSVGDIVMVETPHGLQSAQVESVDDEANFIVDGDYTIRWAVCVLPMEKYKQNQDNDVKLGKALSEEMDHAIKAKMTETADNLLRDTRENLSKFLGG